MYKKRKIDPLTATLVAVPILLGGTLLQTHFDDVAAWVENTRHGFDYDRSEIATQAQFCPIDDPNILGFSLTSKFKQKSKYEDDIFWQRPEVFEPFPFEENKAYSDRVEQFVNAIPDAVVAQINSNMIPVIISGYAAQNAKNIYGYSYQDVHAGKVLSSDQHDVLRRNRKNNFQIASERAHFVKDLLVKRGISGGLIEVYNFGEAEKKEATVRICGGGQPLLAPN